MLYLIKINYKDTVKEHKTARKSMADDGGSESQYHSAAKDLFDKTIFDPADSFIDDAFFQEPVPAAYYCLWDNQKVVGLFKIRNYLDESSRNGTGHIEYQILNEYCKQDYEVKGLKLAIEECKKMIKEDEIYLSSNKSEPALLKTQIKCGAYLYSEDSKKFFSRIKLNNPKKIHFDIRDLKRDDWRRIKDKTVIIEKIANNYFRGKIALLTMNEVEAPLEVDSPVGKVKIADKNYKNIIIAPENTNWWLTVMFDDHDNLIESYFDITRLNNFYDEANPFFIDMKLDVCIPYGHDPAIMDETELFELADNGFITSDDYHNAYDRAYKIIAFYQEHQKEYYDFIFSWLKKLGHRHPDRCRQE